MEKVGDQSAGHLQAPTFVLYNVVRPHSQPSFGFVTQRTGRRQDLSSHKYFNHSNNKHVSCFLLIRSSIISLSCLSLSRELKLS